MLHVPSYLQRWNDKVVWYEANGILPFEQGGGTKGTRDEPNGSIDSAKIDRVLKAVLKV